MKRVALAALLALTGCPNKTSGSTVDAAPSAPSAAAEVDANLPWATEIDMDASTAPSAALAPSPAPSPPPAAVAFSGPTGTYTGNVKDSGQVYTITVNLTPTGGTASYSAPLNCKARWTYQNPGTASGTPTKFQYVEKITEQPKPPTCADNVPITLTKESSIPNAYYYSAGGGQAQSLLKKL